MTPVKTVGAVAQIVTTADVLIVTTRATVLTRDVMTRIPVLAVGARVAVYTVADGGVCSTARPTVSADVDATRADGHRAEARQCIDPVVGVRPCADET